MVSCRGDYAIFEEIAWLQAEDADGFDAHVLISRSIEYGGIRIVGEGAWENVRDAAACMGDANLRNVDRLEAAIEIKIQPSELAHPKLVVDADAGADFFPRVATCLEAVFGFEQFDLRGIFFSFGGPGRRCLFCFLLWFLRVDLVHGLVIAAERKNKNGGDQEHSTSGARAEAYATINRSSPQMGKRAAG